MEENEITLMGLMAAIETTEDIEVVGIFTGTDEMTGDLESLNPDLILLGEITSGENKSEQCHRMISNPMCEFYTKDSNS